MYSDRIRLSSLHSKVMSADEAATHVLDGMTVGMSGFTRAGEAKAVPMALIKRAKENPLKISLITGASLGNDLDGLMAEAGLLARRMPFQADAALHFICEVPHHSRCDARTTRWTNLKYGVGLLCCRMRSNATTNS